MSYDILIFDCYNLFYKAQWIGDDSIINLDKEEIHIGGIIQFFKLANSLIERFGTKDVKVYWLMDNAKTSVLKYRKELSPEYKKSRKIQPDWFYRELDIIELILKYYRDNSELYRLKFLEADDYVQNIIKYCVKDNEKVLLISEDSDWSRNLAENVHQYKNKQVLTKGLFIELNGYEPTYSSICFYKTFYGDVTDDILPTLANLPKVYFLDIISKYKTANEFIFAVKNNILDYLDKGWILKIEKEESNILLNWNLVEGVDISELQLSSYAVKCFFKINKLKIIYASLGLIGKFDERVKVEVKENSIFDMLDGEDLRRF